MDFQETDEYCNAHAHPVFLAGRDRMADLQIVHGRVSLPAKKNQMCTKQRFLLNAELGTEVWGAYDMASHRTHDGLYPAAHASARLEVPVQTRLIAPPAHDSW